MGERFSAYDVLTRTNMFSEAFKIISEKEEHINNLNISRKEKSIERALLLYEPEVEQTINDLAKRHHKVNSCNPFGNLPQFTQVFFFSDLHKPTDIKNRPLWENQAVGHLNIPGGQIIEFTLNLKGIPFLSNFVRSKLSERAEQQISIWERTYGCFNTIINNNQYLIIDGGDRGSDAESLIDALTILYTIDFYEEGRPSLHLAGNHEGCFKYEMWPWLLHDKVFGPSFGYQVVGNKLIAYFDTNLHNDNWYRNTQREIETVRAYARKCRNEDSQKSYELDKLASDLEARLKLRREEQELIITQVDDLGKQGYEVILFGHSPEELRRINQKIHNTTTAVVGHTHIPLDSESHPRLRKIFQNMLGKNASGQNIDVYMVGGIFDFHGINLFPKITSTAIIIDLQAKIDKVRSLFLRAK